MKKMNTKNEYTNSKKRMTKSLIGISAAMMVSVLCAATIAGCGCNNSAGKVQYTTVVATTMPLETLNEQDQAVVDAGLKVDKDGNITDKNGNKVEKTEDGKVEVTTPDGKKVKVDAAEVKKANDNKEKVEEHNKKAEEENKKAVERAEEENKRAEEQAKTAAENDTPKVTKAPTPATPKATKAAQTPTQKVKTPTQKATSAPKATTPVQKPTQKATTPVQKPTAAQKATEKPKTQPTTKADPHAGKTWHEAVYKNVNHPAETKQQWVVDVPAHQETVTEYESRYTDVICWGCGECLDYLSDKEIGDHMLDHYERGERTGYHNGYVQVPVTKTITVEEQGHYETVVVKEAWTEKVLVREAGWY